MSKDEVSAFFVLGSLFTLKTETSIGSYFPLGGNMVFTISAPASERLAVKDGDVALLVNRLDLFVPLLRTEKALRAYDCGCAVAIVDNLAFSTHAAAP